MSKKLVFHGLLVAFAVAALLGSLSRIGYASDQEYKYSGSGKVYKDTSIEITIISKKGASYYEVRGTMHGRGSNEHIKGAYYPSTKKIKAVVFRDYDPPEAHVNLDGYWDEGGQGFVFNFAGDEFICYKDGKKPEIAKKPASPPGDLSKHPFNGVWKTTWGTLDLKIGNDGTATGTYSYKTKKGAAHGTLEGRLVGDYVIKISRWTESVPGEFAAGTGTMTITKDGKHFDGSFDTTEGNTGSGEWSGDKVC